MKYLNLKTTDFKHPISSENFNKALEYIGKNNPLNIKKYNLKKKPASEKHLEKDFNRGVLNVRKKLNGHLGFNGKYTNNMIKFAAKVEEKNVNGVVVLRTKIAHEYYIGIVKCIFKLLSKIDAITGDNLCAQLFTIENSDNYRGKSSFNDKQLKTVAPIQTAIILLSQGNRLSETILNNLKNKIK